MYILYHITTFFANFFSGQLHDSQWFDFRNVSEISVVVAFIFCMNQRGFYDRIKLDFIRCFWQSQVSKRRKDVKMRLAQYGISHDHASGKASVMKESDDIDFAGVFEPSAEVRATLGQSSVYEGVHWFASKEEMLEDETIVGIAAQGTCIAEPHLCTEKFLNTASMFGLTNLRVMTWMHFERS